MPQANVEYIEVCGVKINPKTNIVENGTKPVEERFFYGSNVDYEKLKCIDKDGRYINVEHFSPVIYDLDNPAPAYNKKWEIRDAKGKLLRIEYPTYYKKWWYEQRERCLNGYTVGGVKISGRMYAYLNFWRIKAKKKGKGYIPPRFLDLDKKFFDGIEEAIMNELNYFAIKRRQIGFSEKVAFLMWYEVSFFPASQAIVVAGEERYSINTFRKLKTGMNALSPTVANAGREFYKRRIIDNDSYFKVGFSMDKDAMLGYLSESEQITVKDNPQAVNGKSPTVAILEETGINQWLKATYNMLMPAMLEQGLLSGRIIIGIGTGGEMKKGVDQLMDMAYNPAKFRLYSEKVEDEGNIIDAIPFFPGWMYHIIDNDGNSYKDASIELIMKDRELAKSKKDLHDKKVSFPLTLSEAFSVSGNSPFNNEKLERQRKNLISHEWENKVQRGRLEWIYGSDNKSVIGIEWIPAPAGEEFEVDSEGDLLYWMEIIEHPEQVQDKATFKRLFSENTIANLYYAGTDSYDKDTAKTSDSRGAFSVFKGYLDSNHTSKLFVSRILWRPSKKEKFYEATAMACYYYGCENLIEWSNISIFDWYKNNGHTKLLKERPQITYAQIAETKVDNKFGIDPNTKHIWTEHFASYIEDYFDNVYWLDKVQKYISYRPKKAGGSNDDETISDMLAYENFYDSSESLKRTAKRIEKNKPSQALFGFVRVNGVLRRIT